MDQEWHFRDNSKTKNYRAVPLQIDNYETNNHETLSISLKPSDVRHDLQYHLPTFEKYVSWLVEFTNRHPLTFKNGLIAHMNFIF